MISDPRIPITELITHRLPLSDVQRVHEAILKGEKLNGKEIVKAVINPNLPDENVKKYS